MYLGDILAAFAITFVVAAVGALALMVVTGGVIRFKLGIVLASMMTTVGIALLSSTVDSTGDWKLEGHAPSAVLGGALATATLFFVVLKLR